MPKPRSRNQETQKTSIDDFIHEPEKAVIDTADPNAPRKFKTVSLPLNEYEYNILVEACKKSGRSEKNFFRYAMLKHAEEVSD